MSSNPLARVAGDLRSERAAHGTFPPGPADFDFRRTRIMARDPLSILFPLYREYGPIFSVRLLHARVVFMLGPAANRFILLEHPECFHWRESSFGDLIPLLGDGLLTIDGPYHDEARRIMMPAFHRQQIIAATETMLAEGAAALAGWREGEIVDIYHWTRNVAMRIAMRALLGLDPDDRGHGAAAAEHFERALSYYGIDFHKRLFRGPGSPWRSMQRARAALDEIVFDEIRKRRAETEPRMDILGMLIAARDDDGTGFTDREIRDQVMTLMFAGHDTTTSTVTFLMHELARNPIARERVIAEQDEVLGGEPPTPLQLERELPELGMAIDETLRLYPPAWIGPRRAVRDFEFGGHRVKAGTYVNYSSWASHRLPEVFPDPEAFDPRRFEPERKAALPRGAYVPFGGGSRICIGKRFGQTEVKALATLILQRFRLEHLPGHTMRIRQMPTLSPIGGLPMVVRERDGQLSGSAPSA